MTAAMRQALAAMSEDWLSTATFVNLQLNSVKSEDLQEQNQVLDFLGRYFSEPQHVWKTSRKK